MIIRHAEKPHGAHEGVKAKGKPDPRSLTPRGWQRAGALVRLFHPRPGSYPIPGLAVPAAIFASQVEAGEKSRRPRQTVKPLARALGIEVDQSFGIDSETALSAAVRDADLPTLICWHHENIPKLVSMIAQGVSAPSEWPDQRFDVVWVLQQNSDGKGWTLLQVHQLLLDGDLADDIR